MTTYHRLSDSRNRKVISHSCSGQKSKIKASADSGPGEGSLPVLQVAAFQLGHHMAFSWCMASLQWEKKCWNRNYLGWKQSTFSALKTTFCIFTVHPLLEGSSVFVFVFVLFVCLFVRCFCGLVLTWEYASLMDKHGFLSVKLKTSLSAGTRLYQISNPAHICEFPSLSKITRRKNSAKYKTSPVFLNLLSDNAGICNNVRKKKVNGKLSG